MVTIEHTQINKMKKYIVSLGKKYIEKTIKKCMVLLRYNYTEKSVKKDIRDERFSKVVMFLVNNIHMVNSEKIALCK